MTTVYKLKDYKQTMKFQKDFPSSFKWDERYKTYLLSQKDGIQGIWIVDGNNILAEAILSWNSDNVLNIESFIVDEAHRKQGVGTHLLSEVISWANQMEYTHITGMVPRQGWTMHLFKNFNAKFLVEHRNWKACRAIYVSFYISIKK